MTPQTDAENQLVNYLKNYIGYEGEITPEMHLSTDLGMDSLDADLLAIAFEDRFDIIIDDQSKMLGSVQDVLDYVEGLRHD